ncbi:hypothetical protein I3843_14G078200 [Carya illinoinensis]|nr:hypothetical protein I3843_14G078200 [Carya illinoinensis]
MDPSSAQHQEMPDHMLENMMVCLKGQPDSRKPRPQPEQALNCPRCDSTNTKFCYYNNYSLSQPRYFCKSCRRYWTKGGTLRNVPVGGGCRRNKRSSSSSSSASSSSSSKRTQDQQPAMTPNMTNPSLGAGFPSISYDSPSDLSLAFSRLQKQSCGQLGFDDEQDFPMGNAAGFLGSLRNGFLDNQSVFPSMYYNGYDNNGSMGEADINGGEGVGIIREMAALQPYEELGNAATTAVTVTTMKQELYSSGRENENRVWWGFPWQLNANGMSIDAFDSGRESWNGIAPSSWHGLINSPLL